MQTPLFLMLSKIYFRGANHIIRDNETVKNLKIRNTASHILKYFIKYNWTIISKLN